MPKVNHRRDHDDDTFCPLVSMVCRKWVPCMERRCEFWVTERNDGFSQCVFNNIAKNLGNLSYKASRDGS